MSTAPQRAKTDLSVALPSCSYVNEDSLSLDVVDNVFKKLALVAPVKDALHLLPVHSIANRAISHSLARNDHLRIDVREPAQYRMVGMKKEKMTNPEPLIYVQGSRVSVDSAMTLVQLLLKQMRIVKRISINIENPDLTHLNMLLDEVIKADNVHLEVLQVQRRKGGQSIPKISDLIRANAATLKIVGRIGLKEAAESCSKDLQLNRLSLMTFDLGLDASSSHIFDHLAMIIRSGATFKHLSYTSFVGFDPTEDLIQRFLDSCCVQSLRLTMMKGPFVIPQPDYMVGKVRRVTHLELGEVVEKPNIFNSLVTYEKTFKKVFPNIDDVHYFQQW